MKTRLPKALLLTILCAYSTTLATTTENTVTTSDNVELSAYAPTGTPTTSDNQLPSSNIYTYTEADNLTLTGDAKLGVFTDNGDGSKTFVSNYTSGSQIILNRPVTQTFWGEAIAWSDSYSDVQANNTISPNFKVNGTLTITENAQVVLGGQYRLEKGDSGEYDEYTGLIADKVVVSGNAGVKSLDTHNLKVNTLEVNEGNVSIHTDVQSGNSHFVYEDKDSKQVRIQQNLNINGGSTVINLNQLDKYNDADDTHVFASFGSISFENPSYSYILGALTGADSAKVVKSQITQTAGTLTVNGKTASVGGLNINQSGGTMNISTAGDKNHSWHILSDYGDSKITQSENAVLNIGGIKAYNSKYDTVLNVLQDKGVVYDQTSGELSHEGESVEINPSISIEQTGNGSISIIKGIDFTNQKSGADSTELSTITQSGSGTINLSGEYKGVTFDVTQTGSGAIKMNSDMALNAVTLNNTTATPTDKTEAGLIIADGTTVTANTLTIAGGKLVNNGTLRVAGSMALRSATTPINITDGEVVNNGTIEGAITMSGGTLVAEDGSTISGLTATGGDIEVNGDVTMTGDMILDDEVALIFGDTESTIDLGTNNLELNGANIAVTLTNNDIESLTGVVLFTGAEENTAEWGNQEVTILDESGQETGQKAVLSYTGNADGDVTVTVVPEPTTATLSLLTLAALAARRRRK